MRGRPRASAQRPFPSMMIPMWRGRARERTRSRKASMRVLSATRRLIARRKGRGEQWEDPVAAPVAPPYARQVPPRMLGPYEVLSMVGRGGIGTVYRARHRRSGHEVAVKLLGPPPACDPAAARRLAREFEALRGLRHPNVVRVLDAGVHEGYSFLAMELVQGLDLRSYLSPALDDLGCVGPPPADTPRELLTELDAWAAEPFTEGLLSSDEHSWRGTGSEALREFAALMAEP